MLPSGKELERAPKAPAKVELDDFGDVVRFEEPTRALETGIGPERACAQRKVEGCH
jgi:hypothetical protein